MLFRDFENKFLEVSAEIGNTPGELAQKRMCLTNHLLPYFGALDMESLGAPEVRAYRKLKAEQGYSDNTIKGHLGCLARYLNLARQERALLTPKFHVRGVSFKSTEGGWLTDDERARLLRAASLEGGEIDAMVRFVLLTGLRIGEVLALQPSDVDPQRKFITVRASYDRITQSVKCTKTGEVRSVSLSPSATAALDAIPPHSAGTLFSLSYSQANRAMNRLAKRAGIAKCGWHTLRHTFATMLVSSGATLFAVARLLGHKSVAMTEKYAHLSPSLAKSTTDLLPAL